MRTGCVLHYTRCDYDTQDDMPSSDFRSCFTALRGKGESYQHVTTIGTIPDDVLLEIFDFCRKDQNHTLHEPTLWKWRLLVHVCRRWRQIVFASPLRLNLQIYCTYGTPVRKILGIWPAFPITIHYDLRNGILRSDEDNIITALKHVDRVLDVRVVVFDSQLGKIISLMQEPFPVLRRLCISSKSVDGNMPVLPADFLGGSAQRLQHFSLNRIPYPALPTLLLSASELTRLHLHNIPPTGYISPEAMVSCLAALTSLKILEFGFQSTTSRPDRIPPPPVTRTVLPTLTTFKFRGASEYLEDLVCRIDSPYLNVILIFYVSLRLGGYQIAQLSNFIDRSVGPKFIKCRYAQVTFCNAQVIFDFCDGAYDPDAGWYPTASISYEENDWRVSPISQVVSQFPGTFSNVVHLELDGDPNAEECQYDGPDAGWLHLLHRFSTVKTLLVYRVLSWQVSLALEHFSEEMVDAVLPSLELFCLEGKRVHPVEKFVAARRQSHSPVTVVDTIQEFRKRREFYNSK